MPSRSTLSKVVIAWPLMLLLAAQPANAQSSAEYTAFLNFCASQNGRPSGTPSNPQCLPGGSTSSGYSSSDQAMLGIAGALGSALGNAIRESIEAAERQAAIQRMQQLWELERARIFAAEERERLSREMRQRNEALIANLKGGVQVPSLTISTLGTSQLKLKTADEMFGSGRAVTTAKVDPKLAWDAYLAALQKRNEAKLRLAAASDHKDTSQIVVDAARKRVEAARLSGSSDQLAEAEKLADQAAQLSEQATADLDASKKQADEAAKALELASADASGVAPVSATGDTTVPTEVAAATARARFDSSGDPMVVNVRGDSPAEAAPASIEAVKSTAAAGFDTVNDPMVVDLRDNPSAPLPAIPGHVSSDPMVVDARNAPSVLGSGAGLKEGGNSQGAAETVGAAQPDYAPGFTKESDFIQAAIRIARRTGMPDADVRRLSKALEDARGFKRPDDVDRIDAVWAAMNERLSDPQFAQAASQGRGPEIFLSGWQSGKFDDCVLFAIATATGQPYSVVAAHTNELVKVADWRNNFHRSDPEQVFSRRAGGLNDYEAALVAEAFGQVQTVDPSDYAATLREERPIVIPVAAPNEGFHELVLARTFRHDGLDWFEAIDSALEPGVRRYLSAAELAAIADAKGFTVKPETAVPLLRNSQSQAKTPRSRSPSPWKPQWELDYEAKMAAYQQELEKQRAAVDDFERAKADFAAKRAQLAEQAKTKKEEWERAVAACQAGDHSACSQPPQ